MHKSRTHAELREALQRLIHAVYRQPNTPACFTIPVDEEHDADCILSDGIKELEQLRKYARPALTVDAVIITRMYGKPHVLLGQRSATSDAYPECWAIPGGFVNIAQGETTREAVQREAREETGLDIATWTPLGFFDAPDRDPRDRVVSMAYLADLDRQVVQTKAADDLSSVAWFALDDVPELAFDHADILAAAKKHLSQE